ncbi:hypothetical protein ACIPUC_00020 [Streptomyces sp. LARHCF249]
MNRTLPKRPLVTLGVSAVLAAAGALLPTSAFGAPLAPETGSAATATAVHHVPGQADNGDGENRGSPPSAPSKPNTPTRPPQGTHPCDTMICTDYIPMPTTPPDDADAA